MYVHSLTHICIEKDEASRERVGRCEAKKKTGLAPPKEIMDFDMAGSYYCLLNLLNYIIFSGQYIYLFHFFEEEKFNTCFNITNDK